MDHKIIFVFFLILFKINNAQNETNDDKINAFNTLVSTTHNNSLDPNSFIETKVKILFASRKNVLNQYFFDRSIKEYQQGFTDGKFNFWLGLDLLNELTNKHNYGLRIEFEYNRIIYKEEYSVFKVDNLTNQFKLTVTTPIRDYYYYNETYAPKSFLGHNIAVFSTFDFGKFPHLASQFNAGFWISGGINYYCFSCTTKTESNGLTLTKFILQNGQILGESAITRMYLLP